MSHILELMKIVEADVINIETKFNILKRDFLVNWERMPLPKLRVNQQNLNELNKIIEDAIKSTREIMQELKNEDRPKEEKKVIGLLAKRYNDFCVRILGKLDGLTRLRGEEVIGQLEDIEENFQKINKMLGSN